MTFFQSTYECKIDAKGRILLPAKIKNQILPTGGEGGVQEIVIRFGLEEKCLEVYPLADYERKFSKFMELDDFDLEQKSIKRKLLGKTANAELDSSGRFVIPAIYLAYAQLEKGQEVTVLGVGSKLEIWNPSLHAQADIPDSEVSRLIKKYFKKE